MFTSLASKPRPGANWLTTTGTVDVTATEIAVIAVTVTIQHRENGQPRKS